MQCCNDIIINVLNNNLNLCILVSSLVPMQALFLALSACNIANKAGNRCMHMLIKLGIEPGDEDNQ